MDALLALLRAISEIFSAGIAITAFSLLIYALSFNLRVRLALSFALIMACVAVSFTAEAIGSTASIPAEIDFWLRLQWVGIALLPAVYYHFSDALLATTGKPSRGRRSWIVRLSYLFSAVFLLGIPLKWLAGPTLILTPAPRLQPTLLTDIFLIYYGVMIALAWYNFIRAYRRSTTATSRRRMAYLLAGALSPAIGSLPFLPYSPNLAGEHPILFWGIAVFANLIVGVFIVIMAYSVAFFGVAWPDRVVRARLFKWIMRGPFTASLTLGVATLVRRGGLALGWNYNILAPIATVGTILLCEHFITLLSPLGERVLFYGNDRDDLDRLGRLESQLVTRNDLKQFLEMVLAALSDLLQAAGGYIVAFEPKGSELVVEMGRSRFSGIDGEPTIPQDVFQNPPRPVGQFHTFQWGEDTLIPLYNGDEETPEMIGLIGMTSVVRAQIDGESDHSLELLVQRATLALRDRRVQSQIFLMLDTFSPQADLIQRLRAAGRYGPEGVLVEEENLGTDETLVVMVKEALTHYWGGPRLTGSPLLNFKIVQDSLREYDGNQANALRGILRRAIEQVRPQGERRFTGEWILYNILEMKFVEGKKVREIAMRLAMSEADLYRKQRVAIESVARAISEMESDARQGGINYRN